MGELPPFAGSKDTFIEVAHAQLRKHKQGAEGDVFLSQKNPADGRVITALSDGLGSGIKAGVLATLTATMATKFIASDIPIKKAAQIIMNTLPVCKERGISYATFTLVDIEPNSTVRVIEYDNPPYILIRKQTFVEPIKEFTVIERKNKKTAPKKEAVVQYSQYEALPGDRLVFFSDGVTQAGMGSVHYPFGWGYNNVQNYILEKIEKNPEISARDLAKAVVNQALQIDSFKAKDDITCGIIYSRKPRDLLVLTGPPLYPERDADLSRLFVSFSGKKIVSGGTTANILARETGKKISVCLKNLDPKIPPESVMEGADLVTEGIITMGSVAEILEQGKYSESAKVNAAVRVVELFLDSDRILFVVGTKINEAHQDPNMPVELEIRRNIIKKIATLLQEKYLKEVKIQYI